MNYLLRPIPSTQLGVAEYAAILAHPQVFSLAVQIRLGDQSFTSDVDREQVAEWLKIWFECASQVRRPDANPKPG